MYLIGCGVVEEVVELYGKFCLESGGRRFDLVLV